MHNSFCNMLGTLGGEHLEQLNGFRVWGFTVEGLGITYENRNCSNRPQTVAKTGCKAAKT